MTAKDYIIVKTPAFEELFQKCGFGSVKELLTILFSKDPREFAQNNLVPKEQFINRIISLINSVEQGRSETIDARQMTASGALMESYRHEYRYIHAQYVKRRKMLQNQLTLIKLLLA